jgi:predicted ATPase
LFLKNLGFVTLTDARRITYEETVRFEQIHEQTYRGLGFEIIGIAPGSVSDRVKQIRRTLALGDREGIAADDYPQKPSVDAPRIL